MEEDGSPLGDDWGIVQPGDKADHFVSARYRCGTYLDEFACEFADYDDVIRVVRYSHPATQPDDALHAVNYCLLLGIRVFNSGYAQS